MSEIETPRTDALDREVADMARQLVRSSPPASQTAMLDVANFVQLVTEKLIAAHGSLERELTLALAEKEQAERGEVAIAPQGHDEPCYYCSKPCNSLAGNPNEWAIPLCHSDDPGKVKWHHIGCVSARLRSGAERSLEDTKENWLRDLRAIANAMQSDAYNTEHLVRTAQAHRDTMLGLTRSLEEAKREIGELVDGIKRRTGVALTTDDPSHEWMKAHLRGMQRFIVEWEKRSHPSPQERK